MAALCQRLQPTLDPWTLAQRSQLVALLMARGIVHDTQVAIRYGVPTGPKGETTPLCHVRFDYLEAAALLIQATGCRGCGPSTHHIQRCGISFGPPPPHQHGTLRLGCAVALLYLAQPAGLATRPERIAAEGRALPRRHGARGRAARGGPARLLQRVLQARPIACPSA